MLAEDSQVQGPPQIEDALRLAECLRMDIDAQTVEGTGVTVSAGVASMPADGTTVDELLDAADASLAAASHAGGDRVLRLQPDASPAEHDEFDLLEL